MSQKEIQLTRQMTQQEFEALAEKIERVVKANNYEVVHQHKQDEETVVVEAKHWLSGKPLRLVGRRDDSKIRLDIQERDECERVLEAVVKALGGLVDQVIIKPPLDKDGQEPIPVIPDKQVRGTES